jgi:phospho-2-dehydro-3-deoxyheptonate aldolase
MVATAVHCFCRDSRSVFGVMVESHLVAGAQKFSAGKDDPAKLTYGQSITDACIGWMIPSACSKSWIGR